MRYCILFSLHMKMVYEVILCCFSMFRGTRDRGSEEGNWLPQLKSVFELRVEIFFVKWLLRSEC